MKNVMRIERFNRVWFYDVSRRNSGGVLLFFGVAVNVGNSLLEANYLVA